MGFNYADAEEKFVKSVVLYGHTDTYLYADEGHTQLIDRATALNLLMKGLVVVAYDGGFYTPVSFKDNTTDVSVVIATTINASSSASVTLKTKEASVG